MTIVELHPAAVWTCDNCGRDQFERLVRPSSGHIENAMNAMRNVKSELPDELPDEIPDGEWLMAPDTVTCRQCGASFEVEES